MEGEDNEEEGEEELEEEEEEEREQINIHSAAVYIIIYIFMSSCVGGSKAPPRTISQQDTRCECYINFL